MTVTLYQAQKVFVNLYKAPESKERTIRSPLLGGIVLGSILLILVWVMVRNAWVGDDAYITMRVIENFVAGYGPNFNIGERVQVYTHPLWMFLLSGEYFLFKHVPFMNSQPFLLYYLVIFSSLFLSLLSVLVFCRKLTASWQAAVFGLLVLIFSRSFIHYSTSGLENPLSYLLVVLFLWVVFLDHNKIFLVSLIAGLAILTRQDYLLLFFPFLIYAVWSSEDKLRSILELLAGLTPVLLWHLFSLFYYGFPFPNTAYAKLNTELNRLELLRIGFVYFKDLWVRDRLTLLTILLALIISLVSKRRPHQMIGAGILLYLFYILLIGGDYMSGRFFSVPLVLSLGMLASMDGIRTPAYLWAGLAAIIVGLTVPHSTFSNYPPPGIKDFSVFVYADQVIDERASYYERTGLLSEDKYYIKILYPRPRRWKFDLSQYEVKMLNDLGMKGYSAGPSVHVYDMYALSDPLLARIPSNPRNSAPGHNARPIPEGYLETLWSGENQIEDPAIRLYYSKLETIIKGDLWSLMRLNEIFNMNLGRYDYLIDDYLQRNPPT